MSHLVGCIDYGGRGLVRVIEDGPALAREAAELFITTAAETVAHRGDAAIALSGGSTPKLMGSLLATAAYRERVEWARLQIFWGDERWVPIGSPESNAGEAKRAFLDLVGIPPNRVHPYEIEGVTPEESAGRYEALIRSIVLGSEIPVFDLVLLGMGEDGHTASLFPGTAAVHESERLVVANEVPKLDATRLTFTPPLINAARQVVFLAAGSGKAERLSEVLEGPVDIDRLPAQAVRPRSGRALWLVDRAAAAALARRPA